MFFGKLNTVTFKRRRWVIFVILRCWSTGSYVTVCFHKWHHCEAGSSFSSPFLKDTVNSFTSLNHWNFLLWLCRPQEPFKMCVLTNCIEPTVRFVKASRGFASEDAQRDPKVWDRFENLCYYHISLEIIRKFADSESESKCQKCRFLFLRAKSRIDLKFLRGQCDNPEAGEKWPHH